MKKKLLNILAIFALFVTVAVGLTACGGNSGKSAQPVDVTGKTANFSEVKLIKTTFYEGLSGSVKPNGTEITSVDQITGVYIDTELLFEHYQNLKTKNVGTYITFEQPLGENAKGYVSGTSICITSVLATPGHYYESMDWYKNPANGEAVMRYDFDASRTPTIFMSRVVEHTGEIISGELTGDLIGNKLTLVCPLAYGEINENGLVDIYAFQFTFTLSK